MQSLTCIMQIAFILHGRGMVQEHAYHEMCVYTGVYVH